MRRFSALFFFVAGILVCELISCGTTPQTSLPVPATEGAWVSSGGELFKDANNPWFVRNTREVRYCIQVSPDEVSASPGKIEALFAQAIAYWKVQFHRYHLVPARYDIGIASQTFRRVDCNASPDLKILAGFGTLSPAQVTYLRAPENLVSVAVRTFYDTVNLRGTGFLYLSSDRGPHRLVFNANLVDEPWSHDGLLLRVLIHEMGHVFGIPHVSNGILSAEFPEYILLRSTYERYLRTDDIPPFFLPPDSGYLNCKLSEEASSWFGIPRGACLFFRPPVTGEPPIKVDFFTLEAPGRTMRKIGTGTWYWDHDSAIDISRGVTISLPPEQKVFDPATFKEQDHLFLFGAVFINIEYQLSYVAEGSTEPHALRLRTSPGGYQLSTIDGGEDEQLVYFNPSCPDQAIAGLHSIRACLNP